jgi:hypothetical protein
MDGKPAARIVGLFRKSGWIVTSDGQGHRGAITPREYRIERYEPPIEHLMDELEVHEQVLAGQMKA